VQPAALPDVGGADLSVTVGPVGLPTPKWKWLDRFAVSNLAVSVGIGLYFFPRRQKDQPPRVPDNLFAIRIASPDKPLTLMAEPWGGQAHVGFNFTPNGLTGFQCGLGIVYQVGFSLGPAKARCQGSLAGVFTYRRKEGRSPAVQIDLVLKLNGQVAIAGFVEVHLMLTAMGTWEIQTNSWTFAASVALRVRIGFFAVSVGFRFRCTLPGGGGRMLAERGPAPEADELTESDWLAYRACFAEVA
jgi:hypothetical protein